MKKAILTGCTGQIGIALINRLDAMGVELTLVVRPGSDGLGRLPRSERIGIVECDLAKLPSLASQLPAAYDTFFHLAWDVSIPRNDPFLNAACIRYTLDAAQLAANLGCSVFVGAGTQSEYGAAEGVMCAETVADPQDCYGIAKVAAGKMSRRLCEDLGLRHCWCRITSVYGPYDRDRTALMYCINSLLDGQKPSFTAGEQVLDYLYNEDCAKALILLAQKGKHGVAYPLGSGDARPLRDYLCAVRDQVDPSLPLGLGEKPYSPGQVMRFCVDNSRITTDTGFVPEHSFEEGIRKTIKWIQRCRQTAADASNMNKH